MRRLPDPNDLGPCAARPSAAMQSSSAASTPAPGHVPADRFLESKCLAVRKVISATGPPGKQNQRLPRPRLLNIEARAVCSSRLDLSLLDLQQPKHYTAGCRS